MPPQPWPTGLCEQLEPLVRRVLAPNGSPFTYTGTQTYLVGTREGLAVIDPGPDLREHLAALEAAIGDARVVAICCTHTHRDHSPAAAALKAWSGAKTYGVPLASRDFSPQEGLVDEAHDHDFVPDVTVHDGMRIYGDGFELECLATPGHTANHICYALREEHALFSGDHVMGWSTSVIAPPDGDMGAYLASLERLRARGETIFYPTHGSPIDHPQDWIGQLLAHRRMREEQIRTALALRAQTVAELAQALYPQIDPALAPAAAQQVLAHLRHLQSRSEVVQDDGRWRL